MHGRKTASQAARPEQNEQEQGPRRRRRKFRSYRTLNHLRDGIWSHHGQQAALLEIELSLLEFAVSITRSVHAIEVSVVRDRVSRSVSKSIQKLVQRESVRLPERQ